MNNITLSTFLKKQLDCSKIDKNLLVLLNTITNSCKKINSIIRNGNEYDIFSESNTINVQGEQQKKLDIIANELIIKDSECISCLAGIASEEVETIYEIPNAYIRGDYLLLFDPLDGSSNIDVNISIGTIFSILKTDDNDNSITEKSFLQKGKKQIAAGYIIYGPQTNLVLSIGDGVLSFILDSYNEWVLKEEKITIPVHSSEFSINASNMKLWDSRIKQYIEDCLMGTDGPLKKKYNMRWVGSMVADIHRILRRGGIFLYPKDSNSINGKLRLMYEVNPMSFLIEQAGGLATSGTESILEIEPKELHQRIGVVLGSKAEVEIIKKYYQ
ncbi:class 1 fructose-bisphosphatase [Candidatus Kinetoplastidibacterium crithidiae]|uniref:Fructose-1,6-bisphosphatase class 1 n=1 Tax=Candidatus Kinetoplastidibacterium crithidiae TCC036E TaxID=1208918 RepID=M1L4N0_9PROT|nr:class 1 fructose-bisphosphatase [Candidatus Kinetoplastibacterium crithidii]AFZ82691.1 fructose-1,6-bisphosphatase I [Candidatus Kinetoplastibacterium crithidii (ex Angomonas deanei ATCC 30255)]AGF47653.1 fructose-1,6-bisphosphatase I [Candidatus Kinetoplastibacterium crithidii TCC036E]